MRDGRAVTLGIGGAGGQGRGPAFVRPGCCRDVQQQQQAMRSGLRLGFAWLRRSVHQAMAAPLTQPREPSAPLRAWWLMTHVVAHDSWYGQGRLARADLQADGRQQGGVCAREPVCANAGRRV